MSGALLAALASALGGLGAAFTEASWWFVAVGVASLVMVGTVLVRTLTRFAVLPPLGGLIIMLVGLTFSFAPGEAYIGFVPNGDVLATFSALLAEGFESINEQSAPAQAVPGIVFLLTVGASLLAIMIDLTVTLAARPALVGIPLLGVLVVPTLFMPGAGDPFFFCLTAASYLLVLYLSLGETRTGGAVGVGASAVAFALLLPIVLPPVAEPEDSGTGSNFSVGVNAFISLGDNLRRGTVVRVLTYVTDSGRGEYLTVSTIDAFTGTRWTSESPITHPDASVDTIGPVPGLDATLAVDTTKTAISIVTMGGHWLPVPYAPRSISGADANWSYDPESLAVTSATESSRGEEYEVTSTRADPSAAQLRATGTAVPDGLDRYLALPPGLPEIVAETARSVVAGETTNFDKAIALQSYFTRGDFEYSETAPVADDYDGTSAEVIAEFLEKKSGYCVHFSSAMAVMARALGIPSRIAVGFTPGERIDGEDGAPDYYAVTTLNLHAWPELWFDGVGWVRFEPTVGRGEPPVFAEDRGPSTPTDDDTASPTSTPTRSPVATATPTPTATPTSTASTGGFVPNLVVPSITVGLLVVSGIVVMLLPLLPALRRVARRARRYWRVWRKGAVTEAWAELVDTAIDLGLPVSTVTPRQFAMRVRRGMPTNVASALARLLTAVEATAFSPTRQPGTGSDLRLVRRHLLGTVSRWQRLRAALSPQSAPRRR